MFVSYASNYEDVILNRIFKDVKSGFYIDIGADHPTYSSTTKSFYDRGWSGVNVEPGPNFSLLTQERPRDINLRAVVTDHDGEIDFFINNDLTATSSIHEAMHPEISKRVKNRTKVRVESLSLNTLVRKYVNKDVQFLKIDAEGSEQSIVISTNWSKFRPRIIVAESTEPFTTKRIDHVWSAFISQNGFIESYFDGINTWFVREEDRSLTEAFRIPVNVLDDFAPFGHPLSVSCPNNTEPPGRLRRLAQWCSFR